MVIICFLSVHKLSKTVRQTKIQQELIVEELLQYWYKSLLLCTKYRELMAVCIDLCRDQGNVLLRKKNPKYRERIEQKIIKTLENDLRIEGRWLEKIQHK